MVLIIRRGTEADIVSLLPLFDITTSLKDIPREWLRHVEPYVNRGEGMDGYGGCWLWDGPWDKARNKLLLFTGGKRYEVKRFVMKIFYDFPEDIYVFPCKGVYGNCINPAHLTLKPRYLRPD